MNIGFIGNFKDKYSTENDRAWAFNKIGHSVIAFQENTTSFQDIKPFLDSFDFIIYSHTHGWEFKQIKKLFSYCKRRRIPIISVHLDRWVGLDREKDLGKEATWKTNHLFMADCSPEAEELYKKHHLNYSYLKPGVDERGCYLAVNDSVRFKHDIVFVGTKNYHQEYPFRKQMIDFLQKTYGDNFAHYGGDGLGVLRGHDLNVLYASSKIVVGDSCFCGRPKYWSDRITETKGRGGFLLHPLVKDLPKDIQATYEAGNLESLKKEIDYWLKNDEEREELRQKAFDYVKNNANYTIRAKEIINYVEKNLILKKKNKPKKQTGMIVFANDGGLGNMTRRLYDMIKPDKVMIIDSTGFSKNKKLHLEWYPKDAMCISGFPKDLDIVRFVDGLSSVYCAEDPYNFFLLSYCKNKGIKTVVQSMYEFCNNLQDEQLPVPDLFLMPSYWKIEEMKDRFGEKKVKYLPPPINSKEFERTYKYNLRTEKRRLGKPSFLHVLGTLAFEDRNGTLDLLKAVEKTECDFELTIHSQHKLPDNYIVKSDKIKYRVKSFKNARDIYKGFDGLIIPRRYGGLCLPANEGLMSGLPVMMPDVSPNNELLPKDWLTPVSSSKIIKTKADISCYSSNISALAKKIDDWTTDLPSKEEAHKIGVDNFDPKNLESKYKKILN
jgi:glycosyltransferase involved in cell wall biosynthesis